MAGNCSRDFENVISMAHVTRNSFFTTQHANADGFTTQHANADGFTTQHANADGFTTEFYNTVVSFGYLKRTH